MKRRKAGAAHLVQLAGVVGAVVLSGTVNVLSARHFTRWDWTASRRWSLSPATIDTLRTLDRKTDVWAIAGPGDPVERSLRQLLVSYGAQSPRLEVHWIDPDRDAVQLVDLQRRYGLQAGRAEDGRVATDAIVIVTSGEKHWFLTQEDMFEASADDVHVKPREERALTQAIRSVLGGDKAKLCFTSGHGELSLEPGKDEREWLGGLKGLLEKANYDLATVDATAPGAHAPFAGCTAAIIAGARVPFGSAEANRLRNWLLEGGNLLAAVGPVESPSDGSGTGMAPAGLDEVLAPFGIGLDDDLVHDLAPSVAVPDTHGEGFLATPRPHPVTASLVPGGGDEHPPRIEVFFTRSMRHVSAEGAPLAFDLLVTTEGAYGKTSLAGASEWTDAPPPAPSDAKGPLVIAMASERAPAHADAPHGSRVVVIGSRFALAEDNWREPRPLRGTAFLVENAISWLSARPVVVDVPDRAEVTAAMPISEGDRAYVRLYVVLLMPLAAALLGAAVWLWRAFSEGKPYERPARAREEVP
jgi:ABC-type uncharacterized transport system